MQRFFCGSFMAVPWDQLHWHEIGSCRFKLAKVSRQEITSHSVRKTIALALKPVSYCEPSGLWTHALVNDIPLDPFPVCASDALSIKDGSLFLWHENHWEYLNLSFKEFVEYWRFLKSSTSTPLVDLIGAFNKEHAE